MNILNIKMYNAKLFVCFSTKGNQPLYLFRVIETSYHKNTITLNGKASSRRRKNALKQYCRLRAKSESLHIHLEFQEKLIINA